MKRLFVALDQQSKKSQTEFANDKRESNKKVHREYTYYVILDDDMEDDPKIFGVFGDKQKAVEFKAEKEVEIKKALQDEDEELVEYFDELLVLETTKISPLAGQVLVIVEREQCNAATLSYLENFSGTKKEEDVKREFLEPSVIDFVNDFVHLARDGWDSQESDEEGYVNAAREDYFDQHCYFSKVLTLE